MNTLRKALASVSAAVLVFSTTIGPHFGPQFAKAQSGHWAYDACLALADEGVVDAKWCEDLNAPALRWELGKLVMYVGGLVSVEEVGNADDTGKVAVENGVFKGQNNDPKKLGLTDKVNRAEATVIGLRVFEAIAGYPADGSLPDVKGDEWYAESTKQLVRSGGIKGKQVAGKNVFAAADNITRGEAIYLSLQFYRASEAITVWQDAGNEGAPELADIAALDVVGVYDGSVEVAFGDAGAEPGDEPVTDPAPVTAGGTLTVSLDKSSPAATIFADGTAGDVLAILNFSGKGSVTALKIRHYGISADSDLSGVYVNDAAGVRHGNVVTFSESVAEISFSTNPIVVNGSTTVSLVANISAAAGSKTIGLGIAVATDVTSDAAKTEGSFPVIGAVHTTVDGANSVATLTVDSATIATAARNVNVGTSNQDVGKFTFAAGANEHLLLTRVVFLNNGNAADGDFKNIRVIDPKGAVLCTVTVSVAKIIDCDMSAAPKKIEKGATETWRVTVDIKSGSTRTVQFRIQNDYDVYARGESTGAGVLATAADSVANLSATSEASFPIGDGPAAGAGDNVGAAATAFNSLSFGAGTLLVSKDSSSPTGNISVGAKRATVGAFKLEATGEDMEVQRACFEIDSTGTTFALADLTGTIRLEKSSGVSVFSVTPAALQVDGTCDQVTFSSYFTIKAGTTEVLKVVLDYASNATAGRSHVVSFGSVYYKRLDTNDFQTGAAAAIAANSLTLQAASLSVTSNPALGSQTLVRGGNSKVGSVQFQAGPAEKVQIQTILVSIDNDAAATLTDEDVLTGISNLAIKVGDKTIGTVVASPSGAVSGNSFTVSGLLDIDASSTATVDIYLDLATNADATVRPFIPINGITFVGVSSNASTTTPAAATALQTITTAASGTLAVTTPVQSTQRVLHSGETGTELLSFKLEAVSEAVTVDKLVVRAVNGGGNLVNLKLTDSAGTTVYRSGVSLVSNVATFSGLTLTVPKDTIVTYKVWGDTSVSGVMISAQLVELHMAGIDARGVNSGTSILETSVTAEPSSTSSSGHYPANTVGIFQDGAVTPDTAGIVTANVEESADITVAGALLKDGTAANQTIAANVIVSKLSTSTRRVTTVPAAGGTDVFAVGDLVYVNDVSAAATSGLGVVKVGDANGLNNTEAMTIIYVDDDTDAGTALAFATGDVVVRFAAAAASSVDEADVTNGLGFLTVVGAITFHAPTASVAQNAQFAVVTDAVAANADSSAAGGVINGITLANGVSIFQYTSVTSENPTAASTYSYNVGQVVAVTDADTLANSGLHIVATGVPAGSTLLGAGVPFTGITLVTGAAGDYLATLFTTPTDSNVHTVHDSEPVITKSATAVTDRVLQSLQDIAIFDITASGPRNLTVTAVSLLCTGAGSSNTEFPDNAIEIKVDGTLQASSAENAATCATGNGRAHTFTTPIEIQAGSSKAFLVRMDTAADAGQWATGESVLLRINGTAGRTGGGLSWFYTAAAPSPGTEPDSTTPATVSDSYPVDGTTLLF